MISTINKMITPCLILLFGMVFMPYSQAQEKLKNSKLTRIKGVVIDKETKEPLPFVNLAFVGTSVGTTTDFDGKYEIETQWGSDTLEVSYLGYISAKAAVISETRQVIDFELESESLNLEEVVIKAKKKRYRKKNNPAVDLMRKVIANKKQNSLESNEFYELDKYEKIELDINNITDKFRNRKAFNKFQFIFDNVDTSSVNGKPYLPIFLQEVVAKVYYSKEQNKIREYREGVKLTELEGFLDAQTMTTVTDYLYDEVNIYENKILLLGNEFTSPLSNIAVDFYRFYIADTIEFKGKKAIDMAFIPKIKGNFGFTGNLLIALDDSYQILKVNMNIVDDINLNFVQDLVVDQEFEDKGDGQFFITKEEIIIDYNLTKKGIGFFGKKTAHYNNHVFNQPIATSLFAGTEEVLETREARKLNDTQWATIRPEALSQQEAGTYQMMDTLQTVPAFRRALHIVSFLATGYTPVGKVDIGPVNSFYSVNPVEGFKLRFGGRTNLKFHPKIWIDAYAAYGFKDKRWKGAVAALYSFRENFERNPKHYFRIGYNKETRFPGLFVEFVDTDNIFLSIRRGAATRMLFNESYRAQYYIENQQNLTTTAYVERLAQEPLGSLTFNYTGDNGEPTSLNEIVTSKVGLSFRYAPNADYFQGKVNRYPIYNQYPIFTFSYQGAFKGVAGSTHGYQSLKVGVFKKFRLSFLGFTNFDVEAGKYFGKNIPYLLLHIPKANQSLTMQRNAFNMMNFLEFANDRYFKLNIRHYFNGFFFNRIPLLKKLKLREALIFKMIWGGLSPENNPNLTPSLIQFTQADDGTPETYTLNGKPYMEASVGVLNIFKFVRVDLIKRLNYLDNPNISSFWGVKGLGIRAMVYAEF